MKTLLILISLLAIYKPTLTPKIIEKIESSLDLVFHKSLLDLNLNLTLDEGLKIFNVTSSKAPTLDGTFKFREKTDNTYRYVLIYQYSFFQGIINIPLNIEYVYLNKTYIESSIVIFNFNF